MRANEIKETRPVVLFATIGGSPQPVISAMEATEPVAMYFIVSDGRNGQKSSRGQVEDIEILIDPKQEVMGPGLRHQILCPKAHNIIDVPADDPDKTFEVCRNALRGAKRLYPEYQIVADYTGGTKSMTAGLLMAALAVEGVEAQFMAGQRPNLEVVASGTEKRKVMSSEAVLIDREFRRIESLMAAYDYGAAFELADQLKRRSESAAVQSATKRRISEARTLLSILQKWDAFLHAEAAVDICADHHVGGAAANFLDKAELFKPLCELRENGRSQSTWLLCADLWRNAERSAARHRYDDAIARLYRLVEATIQAQLWLSYNIPSPPPWGKVPERLLEGMSKIKARDAKGQVYEAAGLGLDRSLKFLEALNADDPLCAAMRQGDAPNGRPKWTDKRNNSILAHGFSSLNKNDWITVSSWVKEHIRKFWLEVEFPQLPKNLP